MKDSAGVAFRMLRVNRMIAGRRERIFRMREKLKNIVKDFKTLKRDIAVKGERKFHGDRRGRQKGK